MFIVDHATFQEVLREHSELQSAVQALQRLQAETQARAEGLQAEFDASSAQLARAKGLLYAADEAAAELAAARRRAEELQEQRAMLQTQVGGVLLRNHGLVMP